MATQPCSLPFDDWLEHHANPEGGHPPEPDSGQEFVGRVPNTALYSCDAHVNTRFLPLSGDGITSETPSHLVPQTHTLWLQKRGSAVTGSSLAAFLGFYEPDAGRRLAVVGVSPKLRSPDKLRDKVNELRHGTAREIEDPLSAVYFAWGHRHEKNGVMSFLQAYPHTQVVERGYVEMEFDRLPADVRGVVNGDDLPKMGASPDGIILRCNDVALLEVKTKVPYVPQEGGSWRFIGKRCKPHRTVSAQYFCQIQLTMLSCGVDRCHLVTYTPLGGTKHRIIALDIPWCRMMLKWVSRMYRLAREGGEIEADPFWHDADYVSFVNFTRSKCLEVEEGVVIRSYNGKADTALFWDTLFDVNSQQMDSVPNTPEFGEQDPLVGLLSLVEDLPEIRWTSLLDEPCLTTCARWAQTRPDDVHACCVEFKSAYLKNIVRNPSAYLTWLLRSRFTSCDRT